MDSSDRNVPSYMTNDEETQQSVTKKVPADEAKRTVKNLLKTMVNVDDGNKNKNSYTNLIILVLLALGGSSLYYIMKKPSKRRRNNKKFGKKRRRKKRT